MPQNWLKDKIAAIKKRSLFLFPFCTLLSAALFSLGILHPVFGTIGTFLVPTPLVMLGFCVGIKTVFLGCALSALLINELFGLQFSLYFCFVQIPVVFALLYSARKNYKAIEALAFVVSVAIFSRMILVGVFLAWIGQNPFVPNAEQIKMTIESLYGSVSPASGDVSQWHTWLEHAFTVIPKLFPSFVFLTALLDASINYFLCSHMQKGDEKGLPLLPPLQEWRFSSTLLLPLFVMILMETFSGGATQVKWFALNLRMSLNAFFFLQGLALLWWWCLGRKIWIWRLLPPLFCLFPISWSMFILAGIGDVLFNFRQRAARKS